jgi:hypothetical protein
MIQEDSLDYYVVFLKEVFDALKDELCTSSINKNVQYKVGKSNSEN